MKNLFLILKTRWFREIEAGTKTIEYRERKPFWDRRFSKFRYDKVTFQLGYEKNAPRLHRKIVKIDKTTDFWEIHLAEL